VKGTLADLPIQTRVEKVGEDDSFLASLFGIFSANEVMAATDKMQEVFVSSVEQVSMETLVASSGLALLITLVLFIHIYKKKRKFFKKAAKLVLVFSLVLSWLFSSWPKLPFIDFPPKINEVKAAVAFDAGTESHTGTTGSTSEASFNWTHSPVGTPKGVVVFVFINADVDYETSVSYGSLTLSEYSNFAADIGDEQGRTYVFSAGSSIPTGNQTVTVTRTNNATVMYAVAYTVTASVDTGITGYVDEENNQTLTEVNVDDGSPGTNSIRLAATHWGGSSIPTVGSNSTQGPSIDFGTRTISTVRETTAGQGSRPVGWNTGATSDDVAAVYLAVYELPAINQSAYRWRMDDGSESTASWLDNESTAISNVSTTTTIRLRMEVEETTASATTMNSRLEFSSDASSCTTGTWTALDTSTTAWRVTASANITNDDPTTNQLTASAKTFTAGNIFDTQNEDTTGVSINNTHSEWEWAIQGVTASANTTYRFRVTDAGTTIGYASCGQLTTATSNGYHQPNFRIRSGDAATLNGDTDWAAALNTSVTMDAGKRFRIRFEVEQPDGTGVSQAYILQYRYRTSTEPWGAWAAAPDIGVSGEDGPLEVLTSAQYNDNDKTTAPGGNILAGSGETYVEGSGEENRTTVSYTISNQHAEFEYTILIRGTWGGPNRMKDNDQLEFRMVVSTPSVFTGVYNNPRVTVNMPDYYIGSATIESPGALGPFKDTNGNLYFFMEPAPISGAGNNEPEFLKSTDGGKTWDLVNIAGSPTVNDPEAAAVVQDGDTLYICVMNGQSSADVTYHTFRMSDHSTNPDTWGVIDEAVVTPSTAPGDQSCGIVRRSDTTVVVFYRYSDGTNQRVGYKIRSAVPAWGSQVNLDTTASTNFVFSGATLGASNKTHIFYRDVTNNDIYHKSLSSADSLSSRESVEIDAMSGTNDWGTNMPVYWDDAGSEKIMIGVMDNSDGLMYSVVVTDDGTPETRKQVSDSAVRNSPTGASSQQPVADMAVDSATDKQYALLVPTSDGDIYLDSATNDGGWGTDTDIYTATNIDYVRGQIYTHSAGNGGNKVYGYWYDDNAAGENGFSWYGEKVITTYNLSAYRFFNNADSTDVGSVLANQDTAASMTSDGQVIRLRFLIHVGGNQLGVSGENFKIQIAQKSGTCDTSFSGETYTDLSPSTGTIRYYNNTGVGVTDGAALTANGNDPTHGDPAHTVRNQTYEEANNFTNSQLAISAGEDGKWDITIEDNSAADSTSYCLRVVNSSGTFLDTYTVIPEFTTVPENPILLLGLYPLFLKALKKFRRRRSSFAKATEDK